ncbi:MAG TPA: cytochrome c [Terriglobales bacterium]|jgi:mono/diheme cytochrome c family protein
MLKPFVVLLVLLLCAFAATAQESQTAPKAATPRSFTIPADAAQQVNPVKLTPESIAQGKKYYGYDCAMCHGNNGDGKGDVALDEKLKIGDFRDPATLKDTTDGELFYILKNGHDHMPAEPIRLKPDELWNLINYVRSLANKKAP